MSSIRCVTAHSDASRTEQVVRAQTGVSVIQAAVAEVAAGVEGMDADCRNLPTCATRHIHVGPQWLDHLPPASDDEESMSDFSVLTRRPGSRLSCQMSLTTAPDGLSVGLRATQY